jgi:hypothetical protein
MSSKSAVAVRLAEHGAQAPTSRARKQFNTLVKKLEAERSRLAAWQETLPLLRKLAVEEFPPLARAYDAVQKQLALLLDRAHGHKSMGKRNQDKLEGVICSIASDLLTSGEDEELAALLKKYLGEDDAAGLFADEALFESLAAALQEEMPGFAPEPEAARPLDDAKPAKSAKPPKPSARELRLEAQTALLKQSVRDIYRKLASALHPDREADPAERTRKTELMQRVNAAYQKEDLLALLELQLEIEQIDQAALDNLADERIAQYNAVLRGQLKELELDNFRIEHAVVIEWELPLSRRPQPEQALRAIREELADMRKLQAHAEQELASLQDIKAVKAWLKNVELFDPDDDHWY